MIRAASWPIVALLLAGCTLGHDEPWGMLDFSGVPEGFRTARLLAVDGRDASDGNAAVHLDAGPHRMVLADAANPEESPITVSVDVEAGQRQFVALRQAADGSWEAVVWKREVLQPGSAGRP